MEIFTSIEEIVGNETAAVALGNFDGVHRGHAALILRTVAAARARALKSAVFTFSNHSKNFIAGRTVVKNIVSEADKIALIASMGVDYLFSVPFDAHFHEMPSESFIQHILLARLKATVVGCGFNFRFGQGASGDTATLVDAAGRFGFDLDVMPPFKVGGTLVSSSLIRNLIAEGKVDLCPEYLGRRYSVLGRTIPGNKVGGTLGFPTANIPLDERMVTPPYGVYVSETELNGVIYESVTNIGDRPTIGDGKKLAETHLFGVTGTLYGQDIRVNLVTMLRGEQKFSGLEELKAQITLDKEKAVAFFHGKC
ncbi:MAG: bifunctional riboflavin kinase/FAD synthetase [Clostridiales Family XIII bacterium]|jgi:riboflavin kinase/FMN adenylyltransferase|nr:bifunctional riboflavin kinase/FAD synthetase [Clostridiales Family XIII bacterium]